MKPLPLSNTMLLQPPVALLVPKRRVRKEIISGAIDSVVILGCFDYRLSGIPIVLCHEVEQWRLFADLKDGLHKKLCSLTNEECQRAGFENWRDVASHLFGEKNYYSDEKRRATITLVRFENVRDNLDS